MQILLILWNIFLLVMLQLTCVVFGYVVGRSEDKFNPHRNQENLVGAWCIFAWILFIILLIVTNWGR